MTAPRRRPAILATIALAIVAGASMPRARADDPPEVALRDAEALLTLSRLRTGLSMNAFLRVREGLDGFASKHPVVSEGVTKQFAALKTEFTEKRTAVFRLEAGRGFVDILKREIQARVEPKDAAFADVQAWSRKQAVDRTFEVLTTRLQGIDPAVTPEEARAFFDGRPKRASDWRFAKYGSGSFLIEPPKVKAPAVTPATRDEWWAKANRDERTQFWLAVIVEKSGLFDVAPKRDRSNCALCNGEGLISRTLANATQLTYLCPRCGGSRFDLTVKYR